MAASTAMAGLSACTKLPTEKIVPYVQVRPRKSFRASRSSMRLRCNSGVAAGFLVESHMGRPTKIEGNPEHPGSLGGTDVFAQASILTMYDPDRSQTVIHEGRISDWNAISPQRWVTRAVAFAAKGTGLRILTETVTSPTLGAQFKRFWRSFRKRSGISTSSAGGDNVREGVRNWLSASRSIRFTNSIRQT
jgi:hypothetical protein